MKRIAIATVTLLVIAGMSGVAQAQVGSALGSLYVSSEPDRYNGILQEAPASPTQFSFYLVAEIDYADLDLAAQNASNGMQAWEAQVTIPASLLVANGLGTYFPATSLNIFSAASPPNYNYTVATTQNVLAEATPVALVTYNVILFVPTGPGFANAIEITVGQHNSASEGLQVPSWGEIGPANAECGGPCIRPFAETGNLLISSVVDTETESWGGLKAQFED